MEPLDHLLTSLGLADGSQSAERDLQFRLDPARVRQALSGFVEADQRLWFKHLLQLLYDMELAQAPSLVRLPGDLLRLTIVPVSAEISNQLRLDAVYQRRAWLLSGRPDSVMARVLFELGGPARYYHEGDPSRVLLITNGDFQLGQTDQAVHQPGGLCLEFPARKLTLTGRLFRSDRNRLHKTLQSLAGLHPQPPVLEGMPAVAPDWPFPPLYSDDDDFPVLWDWESVEPAREGGFSWSVSCWGETVEGLENRGQHVMRHPLEKSRPFSGLPILGCYPPALAYRVSPTAWSETATLEVAVRRVFGVSWTATAPKKAELFPIVRGVPGPAVVLHGVPQGLYLAADASHLKTDPSGLALVRDEAYEAWLADLLLWAREQTQLYLPLLARVPKLWMARVKSRAQLDRPVGAWASLWRSVLAGLFAFGPVQGLLDRRAGQLSSWSRRRD